MYYLYQNCVFRVLVTIEPGRSLLIVRNNELFENWKDIQYYFFHEKDYVNKKQTEITLQKFPKFLNFE